MPPQRAAAATPAQAPAPAQADSLAQCGKKEKTFGFIAPQVSFADIFFHLSDMTPGHNILAVGDNVEYTMYILVIGNVV